MKLVQVKPCLRNAFYAFVLALASIGTAHAQTSTEVKVAVRSNQILSAPRGAVAPPDIEAVYESNERYSSEILNCSADVEDRDSGIRRAVGQQAVARCIEVLASKRLEFLQSINIRTTQAEKPALAALPQIDRTRQNEVSKGTALKAPGSTTAAQNEAKVRAAIDALRPGETVVIRVPARPSSSVQTGPRYNPNCPLKYIKRSDADITNPATTDMFIVRIPERTVLTAPGNSGYPSLVELDAHRFVRKANAYSSFLQQSTSGKPVVTCVITTADSRNGSSEICKNNYTGTEFEPEQGLGYSIDRNGNVIQEKCDYCIEDKSGRKFLVGYRPRTDENNSTNFRVIVNSEGRWNGSVATYRLEFWRAYQGNVDFISSRTVADGYYCSFVPPPSFNF